MSESLDTVIACMHLQSLPIPTFLAALQPSTFSLCSCSLKQLKYKQNQSLRKALMQRFEHTYNMAGHCQRERKSTFICGSSSESRK